MIYLPFDTLAIVYYENKVTQMRSSWLFVVVVAASVASARPAAAEQVLIIDAVRVRPEIATETRSQLHAELSSISSSVIDADAAGCAEKDCLPALGTARGVDRVVLLSGGPNSDEGYDLRADVWTRGAELRTTSSSCNFCVSSDMARFATKLARSGLVSAPLAASSPPAGSVATPPAVPLLVSATPAAPPPTTSSRSRLVVPLVVGAAGVAALATGISFWALDGNSASGSCSSGAPPGCSVVYNTKTMGEILTAIGAAGVVASGLLVWRVESDQGTQVAVGLGSLFVGGKF